MRQTPVLCTGGLDLIRKEALSFYRTSSGVCLSWVLEESKGPEGIMRQTPVRVAICALKGTHGA